MTIVATLLHQLVCITNNIVAHFIVNLRVCELYLASMFCVTYSVTSNKDNNNWTIIFFKE